jgi:hypothetical protein
MNNKDECVCDHPKSGHFDSTGRCAVIVCHCQGYEAKPPFFLPHFEVDENTTWKRLLGELTWEVESVRDGIDEVRNRATTAEDLDALRNVVEIRFDDVRAGWDHYETALRHLDDAVHAIEEQLPTFKLSRKGKKKGKK